jgi:hypothetical protein
MDFIQVEAAFAELKGHYEAGDLSGEEFKAELQKLMIQDEQGRWWIIGYETGQWYYHDGEKWVQEEPPRPAPTAPPTHPQHLGAADPTPGSPSGPTAAAISIPKVGAKLGRDGVSVLMITAGWLVCWEVVGWLFIYGDYVGPVFVFLALAIAGCVGGLVTGLVLRWRQPASPWKQVAVVTLGWGIGWAIAGAIRPTWGIAGAIAGLVGGLTTALTLKWTRPSFRWKHIAIVTLGWGIGWAVGGAIQEWAVGGALHQVVVGPIRETDLYLIGWALRAGIGGAIGSWVMFWQLREAGQSAP